MIIFVVITEWTYEFEVDPQNDSKSHVMIEDRDVRSAQADQNELQLQLIDLNMKRKTCI